MNEGLVPSSEMSGYVDLGLPSGTLWAKHNIGAYTETDFGYYFSWGTTKPYREGIDSTDNYSGSFASTISHNLVGDEDCATVLWGDGWRLPTYDESDELEDNCDWEWQTNFNGSGHNGYKVMKKDDHSVYIFLPATGNLGGRTKGGVDSYGNYWTNFFGKSSKCWYFGFSSSDRYMDVLWRGYGFSVRPVRKTNKTYFGYNSLGEMIKNIFLVKKSNSSTYPSLLNHPNGVWDIMFTGYSDLPPSTTSSDRFGVLLTVSESVDAINGDYFQILITTLSEFYIRGGNNSHKIGGVWKKITTS